MPFPEMKHDEPKPKSKGMIHLSRDKGVGYIVLDNSSKRNAISAPMWRAIVDALGAFEIDATVRCVVISGRGNTAFCSGADIGELDQSTVTSTAEPDRLAVEALQKVRSFPKPTIAMISGYCLGAGVAIAIACDLRMASLGATFGVPAARLGLPYNYTGLHRLATLVGPSKTKWILFSGDRLSAEQALRFGLIDDLVSRKELNATVTGLAGRIAANAPLTIASAKHALETAFDVSGERDLEGCAQREQACWESADFTEGRRAFLEKRVPVFQGR